MKKHACMHSPKPNNIWVALQMLEAQMLDYRTVRAPSDYLEWLEGDN